MKKLVVIDVGGTSIKYALWNQQAQELTNKSKVDTPRTLKNFYLKLEDIVAKFDGEELDGVSIAIPGAVNQKTGVIGGISALPYLHNFPIKSEIDKRLNLKVKMENDANSAALAEMKSGAGKNFHNVIFFVIGTGVGGSIVLDRKIVHGTHLLGGEFGMTASHHNKRLSHVATLVHMAELYNEQYKKNLTGRQVLERAHKGDEGALRLVNLMYRNLASAIYNAQFSIDPEVIIIGGGVSANPIFINDLNFAIRDLTNRIGQVPMVPQVIAAKYHNDANLIGAAYNFYQD
ncbi:ROK family protein [Companilactobacillus sp.]|uniref:ROK family protein n=1 Tax=Companilactobacillus sp. TaxID=2767905 RepID=UPI0026369171|nr:ROK family protein [Companilactobacillus sp.]